MNTLTDTVELMTPQPRRKRWARYGSSPYLLGERIASGGMGTVHLGLKQGALGFRRLLAIKRLHGHLAHEVDFVARFKDEIHLVSRLNHPNIVQTLDVLEEAGELALVMEFVEGVTLHELLNDARSAGVELPIALAVGVVSQALHGLHSAHELVDDFGRPLHLVHRDVSPQNIIVAKDGLVKVLDFGVAKASTELHVTRTGQISGKASYMSPEQIVGSSIDRRTDIFAAGVVLWEALTSKRLFRPPGTPESAALRNVLDMRVKPPSELRPDLSPGLERVILRALDRDPGRRFGSARDFALALEDAVAEASASTIASGVAEISGARLAQTANASAALRAEAAAQDVDSYIEHAMPSAVTQAAANSISPEPCLSEATTQALQLKASEPELLTSDVPGVPMMGPPRRLFSRLSVVAPSIVIALLAVLVWQRERIWADNDNERGQTDSPSQQLEDEPEQQALGTPAVAPQPNSPPALQPNSPPALQPNSPPALQASTEARRASSSPEQRSVKAKAGNATNERAVTRRKVPKADRAPTPQKRKSDMNVKRTNTATASVNCSPPTYTDAEGIRHFKPECL